jgi:phenylacetaldehyde dehydrogenase
LTKDLKLFIDGKWVAAKNSKTFPVEDPATNETITYAPAELLRWLPTQ